MKNKVKEFIKSYLPGFILGVISAAVVVVYAETYFPSNQVTYDNTESGLSSSNVQGAIDELYNTCFPPTAGDQIIENASLEKDPYECRYFFTGANPNNYITFNGEDAGWRIISVECDGKIKIIKIDSIGNMKWDESNNNNWARPATLNTYLNSTYYNGLNSTARGQIVASNFSIGAVPSDINMDMSTQVSKENLKKWEGKIALPTVSEYIRTNSNKSSCGTFPSYRDNFGSCKNTTWMYNSNINSSWWTLTPYSYPGHSSIYVFYLYSGGRLGGYINGGNNDTVNIGFAVVRPTLYLSSDIQITGGDGSQNNPYVIS